MNTSALKTILANTFGTIGYLLSIFAWAWIGILYLPIFLNDSRINNLLFPPSSGESTSLPVPSFEASPVMTFTALGITALVLIATAIILIKIPTTVAKTSKNVTTKAARSALPLATKGRPISPAQEKRLTANIIKLIKLLLVVLPVILQFTGLFVEPPVPLNIAMLVSCIIALTALALFMIQYLLAHAFKIQPKNLV